MYQATYVSSLPLWTALFQLHCIELHIVHIYCLTQVYFALKFETQLYVLNFTVIHFVLHCTALCKTPDPFRTDVVYNARRRMLKRDRKPDQGLQQNGIILMMMIFRNPLILNVSVTELGVFPFIKSIFGTESMDTTFTFRRKIPLQIGQTLTTKPFLSVKKSSLGILS